MTSTVKVGRRGEVQLPRHMRALLGLREGDELLVSCEEDSILLKRKARRFAEYLDRLERIRGGRG